MTRWACCFLLIATLLFSKSFANSGGPLTAEELISMIDEVKILDFRGDYFRELDGYIPGSILMTGKESSLPLIEETVVYVLDEIDDVSKTEMILKKFGIQNFKCYLDGMENWIKFGGTVEFPRFIQFKVSLKKSLHF